MHGRCGPEENDEGLSLRFVCRGFCTALQARPQATIKSPFRTCLHRLKAQVQRSQRCCGPLAALSRGANALPPPQPGVSAGVPACHGSCCGVKHASLPFIRLCLCGSELSVLPLTVCSCRHPLCRHQAFAHGHKPQQRSGFARLAHIKTTHQAAANGACTFREGKGAPVPRLESGSQLRRACKRDGSQTRSLPLPTHPVH